MMMQQFDHIYTAQDFSNAQGIIEAHRHGRRRFLSLLDNSLARCGHLRPRVLEVGCGTAVDLHLVAENADCEPYGVDVSVKALGVARSTALAFDRRAHLLVADTARLPFGDSSFDLVFSQGVLEHLSDEESALREQLRVLRTSGHLVVSVPQKYTAYTIMKHIKIRRGSWPWGNEREYSYRRLKKFAGQLGVIEETVLGYGYWLHFLEPAWMMRSAMSKLAKMNPARDARPFRWLCRWYDRLWNRIEERWGHFYMRDIAIVYKKVGGA